MSKNELKAWCTVRCAMPHRIVYNTDAGYKIQWDDGTTYAYSIHTHDGYSARYDYSVYINGALVDAGVIA